MKVRRYTSADYPTLSTWWKAHEWPQVPEVCLPKTGFVVGEMCAGFLYKTDSAISILEFIISDPGADKDERSQALDILIKSLSDEAKQLGFNAILTMAHQKGLVNRFETSGFKKTDEGMTHLMLSPLC